MDDLTQRITMTREEGERRQAIYLEKRRQHARLIDATYGAMFTGGIVASHKSRN